MRGRALHAEGRPEDEGQHTARGDKGLRQGCCGSEGEDPAGRQPLRSDVGLRGEPDGRRALRQGPAWQVAVSAVQARHGPLFGGGSEARTRGLAGGVGCRAARSVAGPGGLRGSDRAALRSFDPGTGDRRAVRRHALRRGRRGQLGEQEECQCQKRLDLRRQATGDEPRGCGSGGAESCWYPGGSRAICALRWILYGQHSKTAGPQPIEEFGEPGVLGRCVWRQESWGLGSERCQGHDGGCGRQGLWGPLHGRRSPPRDRVLG
mmetsp:Transcript_39449/g.100163  ORF Transcript_39449/g.100163 Transcript_39449/m.100163 type:complete len:263 (+) Transcript_39449:240-1028(+)